MQLSYFISATCLNNLLLRKELCNFSKALQMQYNVQHITNWLRQHKLEAAEAELAPLQQAIKLLMIIPKVCGDCFWVLTSRQS